MKTFSVLLAVALVAGASAMVAVPNADALAKAPAGGAVAQLRRRLQTQQEPKVIAQFVSALVAFLERDCEAYAALHSADFTATVNGEVSAAG